MRIDRLNLLAFGPFTNVCLNLERGKEGLHIIYGPNEAGKTSALRALGQLFFGIAGQTEDAFLHPYDRLRIGAVLRNGREASLAVIRRKGNKNTLRDGTDGQAVEDAELRRFLGGLNQELFYQRFGIDRMALERGGQSIGEEGSDLGGLIFGAGLGSVGGVRAVQEKLQAEMAELFKTAGRVQKINRAISAFGNNQAVLKKNLLSSDDYLLHQHYLEDAQRQKNEKEKSRLALRHEQSRLTRIRAALRLLPRRRELLEELATQRDVVLLPADFGNRWREASQARDLAERQRQQAEQDQTRLEEQLLGLEVPEAILAEAEAIEQVQTNLGEYRKGLKDRPRLQAQQSSDEHAAREILRSLGQSADLTQAEPLRLTVAERQCLRDLGSKYEAIEQAVVTTQRELSRLTIKLQQARDKQQQLPPLPDVSVLRLAARRAQSEALIAEQIEETAAALGRAEKQAVFDLGKLRMWSGTLEELERLAVPSFETVDRFDRDIDEVIHRVDGFEAKIREVDAASAEAYRGLERLRLEGEVATEADLLTARNRREAGWQLVRQDWLERQPASEEVRAFIEAHPPAPDLASAFELTVSVTDQLADRLRREADRVANHARLQTEFQQLLARRKQLDEQLLQAREQLQQQRGEWSDLWQSIGIEPLSPREMRGWLDQQSKLAQHSRSIRDQRSRLEQQHERVASAAGPLRQELQRLGESRPVDEPFATTLQHSQRLLEDADNLHKQHDTLRRDVAKLEQDRHDIEERASLAADNRTAWQAQWAEAVVRLNLHANATPAQAGAVVDELDKLFQKLHDARGFAQRVAGIDRDAQSFEQEVRALAERVSPGRVVADTERAAEELKTRLAEARTAATQRGHCRQSLEREEAKQQAARAAEDKAMVQLGILCREASCAQIEELPEAERRSNRRRELEKELKQIEEHLLAQSGGLAIAAFVAEAEKIDSDAVDGELEKLNKRVDDLEREISQCDQTIGMEETKLKGMRESVGAAEVAEESQNLLAQLQTDVRHYAVLRLASAVLQESIDRYRQKNQSSVIERASSLFAALTAGSFAELRIDADEEDKPILRGIRANNREALDTKAMSEGSRDQLYLALRLASIEEYLKEHEPIPFIVDDILVNFDNTRAVAALQVLADLSHKTQVLFFTHHEHLVELAERHVEERVRFVVRLGE